jgi:hypothetical protein
MAWRETFLRRFGPGILGGIALNDWRALLRDKHLSIDASRMPRVVAITFQSFKNSLLRQIEDKRFGSLLEKVAIQPPLFILGHYRNGTTLLHQLLAQDRRFAFPNIYQTTFPHTFLTTEAADTPLLSFFMPSRRPMDNVEMSLSSPQEDEFALCAASLKSPCMAWIFPRQREQFEKYLTFRTAAPSEISRWRDTLELFLKKLTLKYQRPLLLKSPPHTCRIRLLLEMFPEARFIHIHRDPYAVFQSSRRTFRLMLDWNGLQRPELDGLDNWVLRQYREMYDVFFDEKTLIPKHRFHEIRFSDLEKDPVGQLRSAYEMLALPDFRTVESELRKYVASLASYRKNVFTEIAPDLKGRIAREWGRCFEEWGYVL